MKLPEPLVSWAPLLEIFPDDIALCVDAMIRRLEPALGPLRMPRPEPKGEPDGYDGLSRRGPYERLLLSEWALADTVPDEFLRRAASGELSFLRASYATPANARGSFALVDSGPLQLGTPRIGQLALLIALARRAERAAAPFGWAVLQGERPQDRVDARSLGYLLSSRSSLAPSPGDVVRWLEGRDERDDLWAIGPEPTLRLFRRHRLGQAEVRDCLAPGVRALDIRVEPHQRLATELRLELPDDPTATRLLRDPFRAARRQISVPRSRDAVQDLTPLSNLVFAPGCQKLMALVTGGVAVYPVPNSPRAQVGQPKVMPVTGELVAVGWLNRSFVWARVEHERLVLASWKPIRVLHDERSRVFPLERATCAAIREQPRPWLGSMMQEVVPSPRIAIELPRGLLLRLDMGEPLPPPPVIVSDSVAAWARLGNEGRISYVGRVPAIAESAGDWVLQWPNAPAADQVLELSDAQGTEAYLAHRGGPCAALSLGERSWLLLENTRRVRLEAPAGSEVCGMVTRPELGLLVLEGDRRTFVALGRSFAETVFRADHRVERYDVSHDSSHLACTTSDGELVVVALEKRVVVLRLRLHQRDDGG